MPKSVMPRSVSTLDHRRALRWLLAALRGLSSPRLAIFILAGWIVACFVGLILPPSIALGFFASPFVVALGSLLGASLVACFVRRASRRRASVAEPTRAERTPAEAPAERRLVPGRRVVSAALHLSLVALIAGVAVSAATDYHEPAFTVVEGEQREIGTERGVTVELLSFEAAFWPDASARSYTSDVVVREPAGSEKQGEISVNRPLAAAGFRFFQSGYGRAPEISIREPAGNEVGRYAIPLKHFIVNDGIPRPIGSLSLPSLDLSLTVLGPSYGSYDPMLRDDQLYLAVKNTRSGEVAGTVLSEGAYEELGWLSFSYAGDKAFSIISVSRDQARLIVWGAGALFLVLLVWRLWVPRVRPASREAGRPFVQSETP